MNRSTQYVHLSLRIMNCNKNYDIFCGKKLDADTLYSGKTLELRFGDFAH